VIRKGAGVLLPLATGLILATQRQDILRYVRIKQMSLGQGHPEYVPVEGRRGYPQPGRSTPDGTGDFDSARRGGPARTP
jgi:hypothetical protein